MDLILSVGMAIFGLWGIYASIFLITTDSFKAWLGRTEVIF